MCQVGASYTSTVHYVNLVQQASYLFNLRHLLAVQLTCFVPQFTFLLFINDRYVARVLIYKKADNRESKNFKNSYVSICMTRLRYHLVPKCEIRVKIICGHGTMFCWKLYGQIVRDSIISKYTITVPVVNFYWKTL